MTSPTITTQTNCSVTYDCIFMFTDSFTEAADLFHVDTLLSFQFRFFQK